MKATELMPKISDFYKFMAKDRDGTVHLFESKPKADKEIGKWMTDGVAFPISFVIKVKFDDRDWEKCIVGRV